MPNDIEEFIQASAMRYVQSKLDKVMKKMNHKSKFLTIKYKPGKMIKLNNVHLDESVYSIVMCAKCNSAIKVEDGGAVKHYCPYCEVMF